MIIYAAIHLNNCIIYGKQHSDLIKRAVEEFGFDTPIGARTGGFLTHKYQFVFRKQAKRIAVEAGQIPESRLESNKVFISEEIWSDSNPDWYYDEEHGYRECSLRKK